jgi:hypothetical protein
MAFTEVARLATTTVRASSTTATNTYTLPSAPASGQWIVVALYTNQGIIPTGLITGANNIVYSVTCGSIGLNVLEGSTTTGVQDPTVYAAPYASGMTTTLSVRWGNNIAATTLGVAVLIFSGASTTTGSMAFRESNGAFDGAGNTTFGATGAQGSSGVITWANSNNAIPTNYETQQEPFIAAVVDTNVPTSATLQLARSAGSFGVVSNSSGQLSQLGGTPGTLPISSGTGVYNPAGGTAYGVIYGKLGNFTFSYTGVSGNNLTGAVATGIGAFGLADSYAPIMLAGTSVVTITAILNTNSATVPNLNGFLTGSTSYTSGTASANGHVQIGIGGAGTVPARLHLMGGSNVGGYLKQTAYAVQRIHGSNVTNGGGFIYTFAPATRTLTRTSSASQTMASFFRRTWSRLASAVSTRSAQALKVYATNRTAQATHVRAASVGKIANFVRTAKATHVRAANALKLRFATKQAKATHVRAARAVRQRFLNRQVSATQVVSASVTKRVNLTRQASATVNYAISSSKSRTLVRRAVATTVGAARALQFIVTKTHPGTVTGDFKTASVTGKSQTASVVGDFKTASVSTKAKFLVKD